MIEFAGAARSQQPPSDVWSSTSVPQKHTYFGDVLIEQCTSANAAEFQLC